MNSIENIFFLLNSYNNIVTIILTAIIFPVFRYVWNRSLFIFSFKKRMVRKLELIEKYLSDNNLKDENRFIQDIKISIFDEFRGLGFPKVKKLLNADIGDNNFLDFLRLYRMRYIDETGNLTVKGRKAEGKLWLDPSSWDMGNRIVCAINIIITILY
ncbi:hypothetical protein, partial [Rodentibacter caecimuris]|uniref:hypothetical protein n=1 Tax=Rodentibacter caecimuris TaxID=1796644 RepID=UPI00117B48CC